MPRLVSVEANDVPKKALGYCLEIISSPLPVSSPLAHRPIGLPAVKLRKGVAFWKKRPPSDPSG